MRNILILEGSNYCGKSTITQLIKKTLTNATIIELHDFYYLHILKQYPRMENLTSKKEYSALSDNYIKHADKYLTRRNSLILRYCTEMRNEDILIERCFLTQMVYRDLLFGRKDHSELHRLIGGFNEQKAQLIFVTASPQTIAGRIEYGDAEKKKIRQKNATQYHLTDRETLIRKNELYNAYFDSLDFNNKHKLNTDLPLEDLEQNIHEIIQA